MAPRGTYRQIAEGFRSQVQAGDLAPGAMLPSELALVNELGVSRGTVRSALNLLVDEGLIEVVPGQGRRVVGAPSHAKPTNAYERIASELRRRLDAGDFPADVPLPSETALASEYQVSRNTVRRAYRQLAEAGVVVIRQGAGAFAAPR